MILQARMANLMVGASAAAVTIDDVFKVSLWSGSGSTKSIATPFAPNLAWIKARGSAQDHAIYDTARGAADILSSNSTAAAALNTGGLSAFNSTGYTIENDARVNYEGETYVGFAFAEAPGFFDVVTYTGTGSARTVSHSLGVAPGMIIVKNLTTGEWTVYHRSLGATDYLYLNSTQATAASSTRWNNTDPTASVFTVGINANVNNTGDTYVAYLFAHDTTAGGLIQCGSFTTDGSGEATVNLGWEPQFILFKITNATGNWNILDTTRGWNGFPDAALRPNLSNAEDTGASWGSGPNSTGFDFFSGVASQTYVYMTIRAPS